MVPNLILFLILTLLPGTHLRLSEINSGASCTDSLIIEIPVDIESYGIDSTGHWWAITRPYENWRVLIVDGVTYGPYEQITKPLFSNAGTDWVSIVSSDVRWWLVRKNGSQRFPDTIESVYYPTQTDELWWVERIGQDRKLTNGTRVYQIGYPVTQVKLSPQGDVVAWVEKQLDLFCLFRNGEESGCFDEILLGGVWYDGRILSAQRSGNLWTVKLGKKALNTNLSRLHSIQTNVFGQVACWSATESGGGNKVYVYMDDFLNPWESTVLQIVDRDVDLHPYEPLVAFKATSQGRQVVCYNAAEYPQGTKSSSPAFSYNGEFMVYASYQDDNYIVVNGRRQQITAGIPTSLPPAINGSATHVAWPSATTLVVYDLEHDILTMGKMCDQVSEVIYDRRERTFKALALANKKLYLLRCYPN